MSEVIRAKNFRKPKSGSHTFDIHDGAGVRLASITLHNYGYVTAQQEAQAVAKLLASGDWYISRVEVQK